MVRILLGVFEKTGEDSLLSCYPRLQRVDRVVCSGSDPSRGQQESRRQGLEKGATGLTAACTLLEMCETGFGIQPKGVSQALGRTAHPESQVATSNVVAPILGKLGGMGFEKQKALLPCDRFRHWSGLKCTWTSRTPKPGLDQAYKKLALKWHPDTWHEWLKGFVP